MPATPPVCRPVRHRPPRPTPLALLAIPVALAAAAGTAEAHKPSDSYLTLTLPAGGDEAATIRGRWDIALRDLDDAVGLDTDGDGDVTWGELRARHAAIASLALDHLAIAAELAPAATAPCPLALAGPQEVVEHSDGAYTVLHFVARCPAAPRALELRYSLLFDIDAQHRGLLRLERAGATATAIFRADAPAQRIALADGASATDAGAGHFQTFVREGVWHIWAGTDHILFLLALLLPAVLRRERGRWIAADRFRDVAADVLRIVTAFTVAHSITLALSTLGLVQLPSRLVETAIAASVVLAALNNLLPIASARWGVAFALGLLHGFGFSSVLVDLGLPRGALASALLGFNVGVELGQAAIVAAFLPIAYLLRRSWSYRLVLLGGSAAITALAAVWCVERFTG
jgi:HupE/UreJ protein